MGIMRGLLKKERRAPQRIERAHAPLRRAETPVPLMLMLPDAGGIATYQLNQFPSAKSAEFFLDSSLRGQVSEGSVLFWALTWCPQLGGVGGGEAEPLVIIRDVKRPVVYPFSFSDLDSAFEFVRHEMRRGLDLGQVMVYWALPARIEMDFWGRSTIIPPAAPQRRLGPVALTVPAEQPLKPAEFAEGQPERPAPLPRPVNGVPASSREDARYLTEADIAEAVKMMGELTGDAPAATADAPATGRVIPLPVQEPAPQEPQPDYDDSAVIDFPTASLKFQDARNARQAIIAAWNNFALALDEAIDVHVARRVTNQLAWNRLSRAIGQAAEAYEQRLQDEAERAEAARRNAITTAWRNAAVAVADAADERRRQVAAIALGNVVTGLRDSFERAAVRRRVAYASWKNAGQALFDAAHAAEARRAMRKAWLNAAWTLEEAVYAHALEQKARAIRAWRNATVAIIEAYEARLAYEAALRECWSNAALAFGEAHGAYEAHVRMLKGAWQSAGFAIASAVETKRRLGRVNAGLHNFFAALDEAFAAKAYREEMIDIWYDLVDEIVAGAHAQLAHERAVAAWDNVAYALDEVCRAYILRQKRAIRAWARFSKALRGALEAKSRQDAAIAAWNNIAISLGEYAFARGRYEAAVAAWTNAGIVIAEAVAARRRYEAAVLAWANAGLALHEGALAKVRYEFLCEAWLNIGRAMDKAAKACIARQVALEHAWARLTTGFADALQAKLTRDAAIAAWHNAALALDEIVGAYIVRRSLVHAWRNAAIGLAEAVPAYLAQQAAIAAWDNAVVAIKEAVVAEAKMRIAQAGLDKELMAEVDKAVKEAQKTERTTSGRRAKAKKATAQAAAAPEPAAAATLDTVEPEQTPADTQPEETAEKTEEQAPAFGENGNGQSESEVREVFRGLWRIHDGNRWEPREEPFRGFQSPPGRFHHREPNDDDLVI